LAKLSFMGYNPGITTRSFLKAPVMINIDRFVLPRAVEESPLADAVRALFSSTHHGTPAASCGIQLDASVQAVLQRALRTGRLSRGLETALEKLEKEKRGLAHLQRQTGKQQAARVSRLILLGSDASERLRGEVARTLERHAPRVLALALAADSARIGSLLFGANARAKVLLLDHKEAVAGMLIAAAQQADKNAEPIAGRAKLDTPL
jgi:hypothetical protein